MGIIWELQHSNIAIHRYYLFQFLNNLLPAVCVAPYFVNRLSGDLAPCVLLLTPPSAAAAR